MWRGSRAGSAGAPRPRAAAPPTVSVYRICFLVRKRINVLIFCVAIYDCQICVVLCAISLSRVVIFVGVVPCGSAGAPRPRAAAPPIISAPRNGKICKLRSNCVKCVVIVSIV